MPKALRGTIETCAKKYAKLSPALSLGGAVSLYVPRQPRSSSASRVSRTLFTLWCGLLESYQFTPAAADANANGIDNGVSFVVAERRRPAAQASTASLDFATDDNDQWQSIFGPHASIEALIFLLHCSFADVDAAAWVIAFCILDKLQLRHSVENRMGRLCNSPRNAPFRLHLGNCWRNLFVAFSLALKWHIDYHITLNYMVTVLPPNSHDQSSLRGVCAQTEWHMCHSLNFDVSVRPAELLQLLEDFLTLEERECIMCSITHEAALGRFFL
ncbi:uncharacterized protein Tco025E_08808 [Trypanosoma conorhini]|uniref:Uncharacterized protein n=1 Tax=Trypanosoma conorhini TaxID=83891 RepID=A0A3R7KSB1_9TRYP|nr:uncharacterized protein Tco025E_08808 [Trypanosoma conorhini]RNF00401.1 hypothetical protein Tco025E_08808 [Trypanosoma conorhini]